MRKLVPIVIGRSQIFGILVALALGCTTGCRVKTESRWIVSEPMYYSEEQLKTLYFNYEDEFQEIVGIVLASDSFLDRIEESKEEDGDISFKSDKQYFSKEDWAKIEGFFKEIRPYMVMRSIKYGEDIVYFTFSMKTIENQQISTALFNVTTESARDAYASHEDTFVEIDDNWWIGTKTFER